MKRFLRSKLVLSLATIVMIAAAIVIPLSGNIARSHAAAPTPGSNTLPMSGPDALYQIGEAGWSGSSETSDTVNGWGDDQWQLTLSSTRSVSIQVGDCCIVGDNYEVYVDSNLIGTTPPEPLYGSTYSQGTFTTVLTAGSHLITIRDPGGISYYQQGYTFMIPAGYSVTITTAPPPIGGTWISPDNNFRIAGQILHFAAHANAGAGIDHVNFTATWPGASWRIACTASSPTYADVYECAWNLAQAGVPNGGSGPLTVSFDVYDMSGNSSLAPNGTRQEGTNWNAPLHGWGVVGYQPGQGDHIGRDFWAIDLFSTNTAVYPTLPGKVVYAQWNCQTVSGKPPCYGYVVVIDHGNGLYSIYAHLLQGSLPKVGQTVGINDQIGIMSDSGCSASECGVHLHFAVRIGAPNLGVNALFGSDTPVRTPLVV